jgi:hypothetical protein
VTIEDPLVSRQHARITIDDQGARVEDLKSRNGVKVNNQLIKGPTAIKDGDRLRIGTQEMVFCEVAEGSGPVVAKTTGFLRHCSRCRMPYPQELLACPSCGETMQLEEDTMTGQLGGDTSRSWGLQLLREVLDKAIALARIPDAVKALQRIQSQIEERLTGGERLEPAQLDEIACSVCALAAVTRDATHAAWLLGVYPRANVVPSASVMEAVTDLVLSLRGELADAALELAEWLRTAGEHADAPQALKRAEQLIAAMEASRADADQTTRNPALS